MAVRVNEVPIYTRPGTLPVPIGGARHEAIKQIRSQASDQRALGLLQNLLETA